MKKIISAATLILILLVTISSVQGGSLFEDTDSDKKIELNEEPYEYYTYQGMKNLLFSLQENNSDIMSVTSIGETYLGRKIWMVKISDNVEEEEDEPGVLLMGAHHGNEKASYEVLIYFIQHLMECYAKENTDDDEDGKVNEDPIDGFDNDKDGLIDKDPSEGRVRQVINNTQIYLIPMVNPDGVMRNTRKNCAPNYGRFDLRRTITSYGVDLNRNYGYKWYLTFLRPLYYGIMVKKADDEVMYHGPYPFSENETRAVKQFVETHNLNISISYHGYFGIIMYPWYYSMKPTLDEDLYKSVASDMSLINKYNVWGRNVFFGYRGSPGTSEDWLYGRHGILSFCLELEYVWFTDEVLNLCHKHIGLNLYVCEIAGSICTKQKLILQEK